MNARGPRHLTQRVFTAAASAVLIAGMAASLSAQRNDDKAKPSSEHPKLTLIARPVVAIAPARVVFTAELTGGSGDLEDYYCPTVRWEWGDLTSSESGNDCPPYEDGKTQIKRRFTVEHNFQYSGSYKVYVRLKRGSKELTATSVTIKLQPGVHDYDR